MNEKLKVKVYMCSLRKQPPQYFSSASFTTLLMLLTILTLLVACTGETGSGTSVPAARQVLRFPNVGISDVARLDPASGPDANSVLAIDMIFSGLVRADKDLNVIPDQATWEISSDNTVYTFHLKKGITFSDGTPVTAQSYIYTWTRALLPEVKSPIAPVLEEAIVGATAVNAGSTKVLEGVKALDEWTLQVSLVRPTAYFLQLLTVSLFYPLNQKLIEQYGNEGWVHSVAGKGAGTGPFMVKSWDLKSSMVLVPNPRYYGPKTKLSEVEMIFVKEPSTAFRGYRAGQYDFVWGLIPEDQELAKDLPGFTRRPILQTDLLFFNNKMPPFDKKEVRQALAAAIDKKTLAMAIFKNSVAPAPTIIPPGTPGSQPEFPGIPFDRFKAKQLLLSIYPDVTKVPPIVFTYPNSQVSQSEAAALQQMWQNALGIQIRLNPMELAAYNDLTTKREVQFGFTQWSVFFPDPYQWLNLSLLSNAGNNNGNWNNPEFDRLVAQAESSSGDERLKLYAQAERIAILDVGWLPLDHQSMAAVIPAHVHGLILNSKGLYFGDWSSIYLTA